MTCVYCKQPCTRSRYVCDACIARAAVSAAERDAKICMFACPSCPAQIGEPCRTGSGSVRCPHVTREKLAQKETRNAPRK